ncbi:phosphate ABC transporter substrate-binding protein PstS family protein [Terribacillus sp. DMT04]|uniref:phosphate ABC transporter substrate-binding protein PstS family protein n=1 Tax=Terribacillus sp. DMT04 TaxID=2850441 RepID=UPI001C2C1860|nr:phosphate ABC transporter substrate-binding protein PstS family protein [Terribacillus sp. DMT04]QXE00436.1 phosphate ABC transporter substrate-binding protein PstS family protein [Terribacillus sp. DMT04]
MKKMKLSVLLAMFALVIGVLAACGGNAGGEQSEDSNSGNSNSGGGETSDSSIVVSGSSAMQPLVAAAAEKYKEENPDADIQVNAGGSGAGLSQVQEGSVAIGNSDVFAEEKEGIDAEALVDHKVAVVGMTAAINPEVGVDNLTKQQLKDIFTGKITNWSEVGGADQEITLVNRPDSSGTRATFVKFGLDGETPAEGVTEDSSNTVKQIVADTPGAIGYLALSYFDDDSITKASIDGVEPTDETIGSGEFPIWAYQHSYTNGEAEGLAKEFLDYMLSEEIQTTIVPEQGYVPMTAMEVERDAEGNQTDK